MNGKTTDLDWYYSTHNHKPEFLIRYLLLMLFVPPLPVGPYQVLLQGCHSRNITQHHNMNPLTVPPVHDLGPDQQHVSFSCYIDILNIRFG